MSVEAPERIWAYPSNVASWKVAYGSDREILGASVYVRADKLEELAAENERLRNDVGAVMRKGFQRCAEISLRAEKAEAALAEKDKELAALREATIVGEKQIEAALQAARNKLRLIPRAVVAEMLTAAEQAALKETSE